MHGIAVSEKRRIGTINRWFVLIAKISVAILILWILFRSMNMSEIAEAISQASPTYLAIAILCSTAGVLLGAYRWRMALTTQNIWVPFKMVLSLTLVSSFLGFVIPSSFGADSIKGYDMFRYSRQGIPVVASIFFERICGLSSLIIVGSIAILMAFDYMRNEPVLWSIAVIYTTIVLLMISCFSTVLARKITYIVSKVPKFGFLSEKIASLFTAIRLYKTHTKTWLAVLGISILFQFIGILYYYIISLSLTMTVPFKIFLLVIPIITLFTLVPISPGGIGVKEGMFVILFTQFGVSPAVALMMSLIGTALYTIFVLLGGVIYIVRGKRATNTYQKFENR